MKFALILLQIGIVFIIIPIWAIAFSFSFWADRYREFPEFNGYEGQASRT